MEKKDKNNCYECPFRRNVPWSSHSSCSFFKDELKHHLSVCFFNGQLPKITDNKTGEDLISFNPKGVMQGWCMWPSIFDPVWVTCHLPIEKEVSDDPQRLV